MKVYLIGDSHSQVTFPMLASVLTAAGHTVVGQVSKPGWASYSFTAQPSAAGDIEAANPDAVIVALGGNNSRISEAYSSAVNEFLNLVGYPSRRVVWIGPAVALRDDVESRHAWTTKWLKKNLPSDIVFIDGRKYTETGHRDDLVHFTREAYQNWVDGMSGDVLSALKYPAVIHKYRRPALYTFFAASLMVFGYQLYRTYKRRIS
jgi:hypothetical protein